MVLLQPDGTHRTSTVKVLDILKLNSQEKYNYGGIDPSAIKYSTQGDFMRHILFSTLLVIGLRASADTDIYSYNYWGYQTIKSYVTEIANSPLANGGVAVDPAQNQCLPIYKNAINNGVFDIRYALGYFDDSRGTDIIWNNVNYGLSPSLDIGIYNSIRHALTEPCTDRSQLNLCDFRESGDASMGKVLLQKNINLMGSNVLVRITLTQASASESFVDNKGRLADRQKFLTAQSEENYFGGIGVADVVIYNGHSRNGGGPDFNPPILNSELHPNYDGYYRVKRPGISRVLDLIKKGQNKDTVLTFFSCFSKKHFLDALLKANPKQRLVLSADTIDYFDSLKGSIGYLEGLMRGTCRQQLADIAKQGDKMKTSFQGYQIQ